MGAIGGAGYNPPGIASNEITGTGTANYIPKFTGAQVIADSSLTDDGTTVGLSNGKFAVTISTGNINKINNVAYVFPAAQGAANTVLTNDGSGNLTWSPNGVIGGSGTANYISKFTAATTIANSSLTDDGTTVGLASGAFAVTVATGATVIQNTLSLGKASTTAGSIVLYNGTNANTLTINSGVTATTYVLTLPTAQGAANSYLKNDGAGALSWDASVVTASGTINTIAKFTAATVIGNSNILDDGTNITCKGDIVYITNAAGTGAGSLQSLAGAVATNPGQSVTVQAGAGNTTGDGGIAYLRGGAAPGAGTGGAAYLYGGDSTTGEGGGAYCNGGAGATNGGQVAFTGGIGTTLTGGGANISAGAGGTTGGNATIAGGQGVSGDGGSARMDGGNGGTNGGAITISGGTGTTALGGNVSISGGTGVNASSQGTIFINGLTTTFQAVTHTFSNQVGTGAGIIQSVADQQLTVRAQDSVVGAGASITVSAGAAAAASGLGGGSIILTPGAGDGAGVAGYVQVSTSYLLLGTGSSATGSLVFANATNNNTLTINSGVTSASHAWTLPLAQGAANSLLSNNGSGVLSWVTTFIGALTGNADTATTATNTINTGITDDITTNATMYPTWVTANTGNLPQTVTSTKLTFNPSTGLLSSTGFSGVYNMINGDSNITGATGSDPHISLTVPNTRKITLNSASACSVALTCSADSAATAYDLRLGAAGQLTWSATNPLLAADSGISRIGAASIQITNGTTGLGSLTASSIITTTANTASINIKSISELVTVASGSTTHDSVSNLLPASAFIVGVVARVTVALDGGPVTWSLGVVGDTARFIAAGTSGAANTTGSSFALATPLAPYMNASAGTIRITTSGDPGASNGRIRITVFYFDLTVPAS